MATLFVTIRCDIHLQTQSVLGIQNMLLTAAINFIVLPITMIVTLQSTIFVSTRNEGNTIALVTDFQLFTCMNYNYICHFENYSYLLNTIEYEPTASTGTLYHLLMKCRKNC